MSAERSVTSEANSSRSEPSRALRLAAVATILGVGVCAYSTGFDGAFLFDDHTDIDGNAAIRSLTPLSRVLFGQGQTGIGGRPFVALTYAWNYAWSGYETWSWHAVNLAIHIATALFLFGAVRRALVAPPFAGRWADASTGVAWATAAIWVAHPLTTGAVQYLGQRVESLMGLCFVATFYFALRSFADRRARLWVGLAATACALGTGCKEVIVGAPLLVLLYDALFLSGDARAAWRASRSLYVGLFCSWIFVAAWVVLAEGRSESVGFGDANVGVWEYLTTQAWAVVHYARLSLWPWPLCFDYGTRPITAPAEWAPYAALVVAALAWTVYGISKRRAAAFLGAWWFVILAPSSSVLPIVTELVVEHRAYLPSAAIVFGCVLFAHTALQRVPSPARVRAALEFTSAALVCLVAVFATRARCSDYATEIGMWKDVVEKRPDNDRGHASYGNDLASSGQVAEAGRHFAEAVRLAPDNPYWRANLGTWLLGQRRTDEAIAELERSRALLPTYGITLQNLGSAYQSRGDVARALEAWRSSLDHGAPLAAMVAERLWSLHRAAGREAQALDAARAGAAAAPDDAAACTLLARALLQTKQANLRNPGEAMGWIQRARSLRSDDPEALEWLGECYVQQGKPDAAATALRTAAAMWRAAGTPSRAESCDKRAAALGR